jgi:hypothetical protein
LIAAKAQDLRSLLVGTMTEERIRLREEVQEQMRALGELKQMAAAYGAPHLLRPALPCRPVFATAAAARSAAGASVTHHVQTSVPLCPPPPLPLASLPPGVDISRPATTAREAVQGLYFAYLGAVKEQDGAAMSLGRVDAFLDTYIEADLQAGRIGEDEAQELIDQVILSFLSILCFFLSFFLSLFLRVFLSDRPGGPPPSPLQPQRQLAAEASWEGGGCGRVQGQQRRLATSGWACCCYLFPKSWLGMLTQPCEPSPRCRPRSL